MHISDWSSVVCSSDLLAFRQGFRIDARGIGAQPVEKDPEGLPLPVDERLFAGGGGGAGRDVHRHVADREHVAAFLRAQRAEAQDEHEQEREREEAVEHCKDFRFGYGRRRLSPTVYTPAIARLPSPPHPPRSEEHTSELQSLMRISYAVFCLKK